MILSGANALGRIQCDDSNVMLESVADGSAIVRPSDDAGAAIGAVNDDRRRENQRLLLELLLLFR
jgi:hypothetical protein